MEPAGKIQEELKKQKAEPHRPNVLVFDQVTGNLVTANSWEAGRQKGQVVDQIYKDGFFA